MNKSWKYVERAADVDFFLTEYSRLCAKHGIRVGQWSYYAEDAGLHLESHEVGERLMDEGNDKHVYTYGEHAD